MTPQLALSFLTFFESLGLSTLAAPLHLPKPRGVAIGVRDNFYFRFWQAEGLRARLTNRNLATDYERKFGKCCE